MFAIVVIKRFLEKFEPHLKNVLSIPWLVFPIIVDLNIVVVIIRVTVVNVVVHINTNIVKNTADRNRFRSFIPQA